MNFTIYFCADGILRAKFAENKPMLPLKFIQENSPFKKNDFRFLTKWWDSHTYFEKGLTVSSFLHCLEPWQDFWSDLTGKDVNQYITEVRRPHIVKTKEDSEENNSLDWIQLSHNIDAEIESEFERTPEDEALLETDIEAWFNADKKMRLTGKWNIYNSFSLSGFIKGHDTQYSVEYIAINELANVPLVLNHNLALTISEHQLRIYSGKKKDSILKKNAFGITTLGENHSLVGYTDFTLREVVEGFFHWMFRNPKSANAFIESLKESVEEIRCANDCYENSHDYENNVIPLFKNGVVTEPVKEEPEDKKMEIKMAPNAFSSIIDHWEKDSAFWDNMIKKALSEDIIAKIGASIKQEPLEKRFFGFLLDESNPQHIPPPTEFKEV